MFYLYVLKNDIDELYFGSTNDLRKRLKEHNSGASKSTRKHKWKLIYYESYVAEVDARNREHQIKYHGQAKAQLKRRIKNCIEDQS